MVVSRRIAELRKRRGWSATKLAEACAEQGMPELNRSVIANIESRRRKTVTLDEMMILALVLDVAPVHLFVDTDVADEYEFDVYAVTPESWLPVSGVRNWVRGDAPLPGQDPRVYFSEVPRENFRASHPTGEKIRERSESLQKYRELKAEFGFFDQTDGEIDGLDPEKK